ncbi:hypothetical protein FB45DRAFT_861343 [Roridomyces roridus]|uniref:DUF6534 domain-containing protein n=1 Tax=Roridomyces roridus TaxID=1738132 RepID=A0AAD7FWT0_9AGAR|nr:hypothetical protein FB45DRAFT_861343 [Roridomyces roridus]
MYNISFCQLSASPTDVEPVTCRAGEPMHQLTSIKSEFDQSLLASVPPPSSLTRSGHTRFAMNREVCVSHWPSIISQYLTAWARRQVPSFGHKLGERYRLLDCKSQYHPTHRLVRHLFIYSWFSSDVTHPELGWRQVRLVLSTRNTIEIASSSFTLISPIVGSRTLRKIIQAPRQRWGIYGPWSRTLHYRNRVPQSSSSGRFNGAAILLSSIFPKDKPWVKVLVYALYCVILFSVIVDLDTFFNIFGPGFGDILGLVKIRLNWIVGAVSAGLVALASQAFYAHRIYILSDGNRILPALVLAISLASAAASFALGALIAQADSVLALQGPRMTAIGGVYAGGTAACDILIAVSMTYYLTKADVGFRRTHALISKLVWLIIGTGSLTGAVFMLALAISALVALGLYLGLPDKLYYQTPSGLLPYLHPNSVLVILNSRLQLSRGRVDEISGGITISNLQFAGPASNGTNTEPPSTVTNGARVATTTELDEMKEMEGAASRHIVLSGQMGLNSGSSEVSGAEEDRETEYAESISVGTKVLRGSKWDNKFVIRGNRDAFANSSALHTPPVTYTNLHGPSHSASNLKPRELRRALAQEVRQAEQAAAWEWDVSSSPYLRLRFIPTF